MGITRGESQLEKAERLGRDAQGLRDAARMYHQSQKGAGGASICGCGASGGGSSACNAMSRISHIAWAVLENRALSEDDKLFLQMLSGVA